MVKVAVDLKPILGTLGVRQKYTLDGLPVNHRLPCTLKFTLTQINLLQLLTTETPWFIP